ncbi:DUF6644 family protein [Sinorhizobium sp. BG8]|uniref:DUF6644 family protein n=1 Tax=Sinorhizobium sp. BG8 TaxID=2613773 RepID=UPI00193D88EC|nr:DUF6644 family protein [Sinorhizobium sp. BG8]QRM54622.1 DUF2214 domain-containing protein [Sinorhizobium sp. BG8]
MDVLAWLSASPLAAALRASGTLYLFVNAAHILSIGLLVGAILPLDLKMIGLIRSAPLEVVGPFLSRVAATGLALAIVTGLCLFSVKPAEYAANPAFLVKLSLLAFGIANALATRLNGRWRQAIASGYASARLRVQAFLSLVVWIGTVVAGRWIGFL